jgi:hypothetical protein
MITDGHRADASGVRQPESTVAVADQMTRRFVPGEGFGHLARNPLRRGISGNGDPDQSPSRVVENHQAIEKSEGDGADHEQIKRCNPGGLVSQEALPALRPRSPDSNHIASDGRFADLDSEHQQFAVNAWRTPEWIFPADAADQMTEPAINPGPSSAPPRLPAPVGAKSLAMPTQHRLGLHDDHGIQQRRENAAQPDQDQAQYFAI